MAKKLIYNYAFDASAQTITITGLFTLRTLILITNVTDGAIIYNFADANTGGTTSYDANNNETTITLEYNTTSMSDSDEIQILVDEQENKIDPGESILDPVHKMRVSNPQNLIDTDFEYGLQPTKWETIELVDNIPSVYTRDSGVSIGQINRVTTIANSNYITVFTGVAHDLAVGDPIEVQGTTSRTANGKYVVTTVVSDTSFIYKARTVQSSSTDIRTAYTTIIPGSFFTGSDIVFNLYDGIKTDGGSPSTLTISADYKHGLINGTSVYLSNTVGKKEFTLNNTSSNAADGSPTINPTDESLYLDNHNLYTGQKVFVTAQTGGILPTAATGAPPPAGEEALNNVWTHASNAIQTIKDQINADGYDAYLAMENDVSNSLYYSRGSYTTVTANGLANKYQRLIYGHYGNFRSPNYLSIANQNSTQLIANYNFSQHQFTPSQLYTGQVVDYGALGAKTGGSDPISGSFDGVFLAKFSAFEYLGSLPYALTIYQIPEPNLWANGARIVWRETDYYSMYGSTSNYRSLDEREQQSTKQILSNGWQYSYYCAEYNPRYGLPGYIGMTIHLENTNWSGYFSNSVNWRWNYQNSMVPLTAQLYNQHGGSYLIKTLIPYHDGSTSYTTSYFAASSASYLTYAQIANNIASQIANNVAFGQWQNTGTGNQNTAFVTNKGTNRITLSDANNNAFNLSTNGQGPILVETEQVAGVHDDYYALTGAAATSFTLQGSGTIPARELDFTNSDVIEDGGEYYIKISGHGLGDGSIVTYSVITGSAPGGLTGGNQYYAIVIDSDYIQLAETQSEWSGNINAITGTQGVSATYKLFVFSVSGRVASTGTISIASSDSKVVEGTSTKFSSTYKIGDRFNIVSFGSTVNQFVSREITSIVSDTSLALDGGVGFVTTGASHYVDTKVNVRADGTFLHRPFDGGVDITAGSSPDSQIVRQTRKYFRYQSGKGIQCSMAINFNPSRQVLSITGSGTNATVTTEYPHGLTTGDTVSITGTEEHISLTPTNAAYDSDTGLLTITVNGHGILKGEFITLEEESITFTCAKDGHATNHPYPRSTDPAGGRERLKVLSVTTNTFVVDVGTSTYVGAHTFVSADADAVTHIDTSNAYNGTFEITSATDFTFGYTTDGSVVQNNPKGFVDYVISGYKNAGIRAGLFDFQNGFFFEYDGKYLYCVRRSSVQQIPGTVQVVNRSNVINGTSTKFTDTLVAGDRVVIRGQTYKITSVESDTSIHVQPAYRGTSNRGVIVTKTVDTRVPQHRWNIDKSDGSGPSGYILDINKIQMAYMDYSWYGAGKIRFGFKDTYGHVKYVHEFIHNNKLNEAYMRSGNVPARYEVYNEDASPTYVPSLFHWGTSVIMDGGFDDDDSYLFTASGNTLTFTNGDASTAVTSGGSTLISSGWGRYRTYYVKIPFATSDSSKFQTGIPLFTSDSVLNGQPVDYTSYSSTSFDVHILISSGYSTPVAYPTIAGGTTVSIGAQVVGTTGIDLNSNIPLISVRLAPSADNNIIGNLGERDIVNRMQLKMRELGISVSHDANISVILNGSLSNLTYENVGSPSLSQYVAHEAGDTVDGGTVVYQFRASGGSEDSAGKRFVSSTQFDLSGLVDLGNSILGGDGVFPNGPDIITIAASVINTAEIDSTSSFQVASRISWAESQA